MSLVRNIFRLALAFTLLSLPSFADTSTVATDGVDEKTRPLLVEAVRKELNKMTDSKNADGKRDKNANYSQFFKKNDDGTYLGSFQVNTAGEETETTERFNVTLVTKGDGFEAKDTTLVDTWVGLHRALGVTCYDFDAFNFSREGMSANATSGGVCEWYFQGEVVGFIVMAPDLKYDYEVPAHVATLQNNHDFYALRNILSKDHSDVMVFDADRFTVTCDTQSCEELLTESFTGLERGAPDDRPTTSVGLDNVPTDLRNRIEKNDRETRESIRDDPFFGFRRPTDPGNRHYIAAARKGENQTLGIRYDNWEGYEVQFFVAHELMDREAPRGVLFGYYTEETLKTTTFYELEKRDDQDNRWYDVFKVKADAIAGVNDPEMLSATVDYGLNIKHDLDVLPFFIYTNPDSFDEDYKRATLFVNSIRINGQEVTWVKTNAYGGLAVLPEVASAGSTLEISVSFETKAIRKYTPSYSQLARFGWLPFVRFGDFVEDFEMTIRTPSQYTVLGVGHKTEERKEGDTLVTHWKADSPVVFPSVIFGKYFSDKPSFAAKKIDGTEIPVEVHVDEVSMMITKYKMQLATGDTSIRRDDGTLKTVEGTVGIRAKQLRSIADQAANAINLYGSLSGLDYPYAALNLVNDPQLAMYGQAPSSLIYLGSLVFRGEGEMSGEGSFFGGGGTGTSKFLKSVVAHEVGHQWWGSSISNSNQRNYWFVETLAEYFSALYLEAVYGPKEYEEQVEEWRRNILRSNLKTSVQAADSLWPGESGGGARQSLIYNKGPYAFHVLRQTFGDEKFFPFLKGFTQELAEKQEIVSRDIQLAAERHLGGLDEQGNHYNVDLEWFFDQWIRGVGIPEFTLDYDVRQTEDGSYLIEGNVSQAVVIGNGKSATRVEDRFYRGVIDLTVRGGKKGEEYKKRLVIDGPATDFKVKVPVKPVTVAINENGGMLSQDVVDATIR